MIAEPLYLIPPILLSKDLRSALMNVALTSLVRGLYLSYLAIAYGLDIGMSGYFRGAILVSSAFLAFYFGSPEPKYTSLAFISAYSAMFPREVPALLSLTALFVRYTIEEPLLYPYAHAILSGIPVVLALSVLSLNSYLMSLLSAFLLSYRLLLLIEEAGIAFFLSRLSISAVIALSVFFMMPEGRYVIGAAMIRPSTIGSEAMRIAIVTKKQEVLALSIATYVLTLYTLYGEPIEYFLLGLVAFVLSVFLVAAYNEIIS